MADKETELEKILASASLLVGRAETCVLSSLALDGYPAMRAMLAPRERTGMKQLIFSTNTSSLHVDEFHVDPRGCVYFYDPKLFQGLLLRGTVEIDDTKEMRERIWRDGDEVYYPLGVTDPDYTTMTFTATQGRWYENFIKVDFYLEETL